MEIRHLEKGRSAGSRTEMTGIETSCAGLIEPVRIEAARSEAGMPGTVIGMPATGSIGLKVPAVKSGREANAGLVQKIKITPVRLKPQLK